MFDKENENNNLQNQNPVNDGINNHQNIQQPQMYPNHQQGYPTQQVPIYPAQPVYPTQQAPIAPYPTQVVNTVPTGGGQ
ncbi:hypothetical protein [Mycoplasma elephantis]|uniref:hypothetical protein n=1 Tax=Mycoplasma elephantis TaxID=114882 RepID=UPI0004864787|nr:hypothetical protein [Mycoplasma elephantis]